ncbi:hypothetical protein EYC80_010212 [Monilinia laxa]|uniref:Uncharacterized protein n=1 Tax=Monilinia laxa TaxID=61186 RepID=A0A5N6JNJ5_MONLA|nr:hypothetical protein EYC80_010212 [Monilinia laxa]
MGASILDIYSYFSELDLGDIENSGFAAQNKSLSVKLTIIKNSQPTYHLTLPHPPHPNPQCLAPPPP